MGGLPSLRSSVSPCVIHSFRFRALLPLWLDFLPRTFRVYFERDTFPDSSSADAFENSRKVAYTCAHDVFNYIVKLVYETWEHSDGETGSSRNWVISSASRHLQVSSFLCKLLISFGCWIALAGVSGTVFTT